MGFYELRYSGKPAAFLRGFRAIYLGVFFNVMIMATVTLAAIKIGGVLLGLDKFTTVAVAGGVTVLYSASSGLWGVVVTDLLLFVVAMVGSVAAAYYAVAQPEVGGLAGLFSHPDVVGKPEPAPRLLRLEARRPRCFVIPIAVQWWSTWYPGAEPGGGGYIAQRMLAARNEKDAMRRRSGSTSRTTRYGPGRGSSWRWRRSSCTRRCDSSGSALPQHRSQHPAERPRVSGDARARAPRHPRPDRGLSRRRLHVHDQHAPELGRKLFRRRLLPPLHLARPR